MQSRSRVRRGCTAGLVMLLITAAQPAAAAPNDPTNPPAAQSCSFTLGGPAMTSLPGGAPAMTATLAADSCDGQPVDVHVCITAPDGQSQCATNYSFNTAQVLVPVAPAHGVFTVTGVGCWRPGVDTDNICERRGPVSKTF